jgi:DNA-binding NtrC family response regulator
MSTARGCTRPSHGKVHLAGTISEAEALLAKGFDWAAMVLDRRLPDGDGLDFLGFARHSYPETPAALFTGFMEDDTVGRVHALGAERQLDFPMDDDCIAPSMRLGDLA